MKVIKEDDPRFAETVFAVEATSFEQFCLWEKFHKEVDWKQGSGLLCTIGHLDKRPICVVVSFEKLNGHTVMFYEASSQVIDYLQVEAWVKENIKATWGGGRWAQTDASNFHSCLHALAEIVPSPAKEN